MKSNVSSKHLSRHFPCYRGLTLPELKKTVQIISFCFFIAGIIIGAFVHKTVGVAILMSIIGLILSASIAPKKIAKMKDGFPEGYLIKKYKILFEKLINRKGTYFFHEGRWMTSKSLGVRDV